MGRSRSSQSMDAPARIAVVGPVDDRLVGDLRALPLRPMVRQWASLCDDTEALVQFQPTALLVAVPTAAGEELGALRVLQKLWPGTGVVLVTSAAQELEHAPLAARLGARLLVHPDGPGSLAAALEQAFHGGGRPRTETLIELARGVADEVNNPLMALVGRLQLLRGNLDPRTARDLRDQVALALTEANRVQEAVDRLRLAAGAAGGPRRPAPVDLGPLVGAAVRACGTDDPAPAVAVADALPPVAGDPAQLSAAVVAIVAFAFDLARVAADTHLGVDALPHGVRLRVVASGPGLATWNLPATFEPYYPRRALRSQAPGLGLFVAEAVVLGHRGQATARRRRDGALQVDFVLPT